MRDSTLQSATGPGMLSTDGLKIFLHCPNGGLL